MTGQRRQVPPGRDRLGSARRRTGSTPRSAAAPPRRSSRRRRRAPRRSSRSGPAPTGAACRPRAPIRPAPSASPRCIKDKPVVNIAGCPPIGDVVTATIVHYLTFGRLPALDAGGTAALRLRRPDPRPVPQAGQLRRRSVRRGVRRRGGPQGLVPLPGRLQGAGDLLALSDLPVEHADQLADRRRPSVHRLHRAELLGHDDARSTAGCPTSAASASRAGST